MLTVENRSSAAHGFELAADNIHCHFDGCKILGRLSVRPANFRFWNDDFVKGIELYDLKAVNQLEKIFLSACKYKLFVDEPTYSKYFIAVIEKASMFESGKASPIKRLGGRRIRNVDEEEVSSSKLALPPVFYRKDSMSL